MFKKDGWRSNWRKEHKQADRQVYKLLIGDSQEIQELISLEVKKLEKFIELPLIESAPHNFGSGKRFIGVAGNLVVFACRMSFEMGFDGCLVFIAKSRLVQHYIDTFGTRVIAGNKMGIFPGVAKTLVNSYNKNFIQ